MSAFDDILKAVAEDDRAVLSKYPQIKETIEKIEENLAAAQAYANEWADYIDGKLDPQTGKRIGGEFDREAGNFRRVIEAEKRANEAQQRIAALEAAVETGADMTFDEILTGLKQKGFVTKDEVQDAVKPLTANLAKREELSGLAGNMGFLYGRTASLPARYLHEFGDPNFDMDKFLEFVQQSGSVADPMAAYDRYVAPKREELRLAAEKKKEEEWQAKLAAEREAAKREGIEQGRKEAAMSAEKLPTDQFGAAPSMMPGIRERIEKARKPDGTLEVPADMSLKDPALAVLGAKMLAEGKFAEREQVQ